MNKTKIHILNIIFLILCIAGYFFLDNILTFLSPDGYVKNLIFFKKIYIVFGLVIFMFLNSILFIEQIRHFLITFFQSLLSYCLMKKKLILNISIIIILLYIIVSGLFLINRLDVSTDESTYVSTFRNYISNNHLVYSKQDDTFAIPKDMFGQNLILIIAKPIINNPILTPRYITFIYSIILLALIGFYFYKNHRERGLLIFLVLCASYPGFIYLTGSGFGEHIAILFLISGLSLWNSSWHHQHSKMARYFLGAVFVAIAIMTKLQLGIFLLFSFMTIIFFNLFRQKSIKKELKFVASFVILFSLFYAIYLLALYDTGSIIKLVKQLYITNISLGTSGVKSFFYYLNSLYRFFGFYNIVLVSILFYYLIKNRVSMSYFTGLLFLMIFYDFLWYINKSYCFRFMYFSNFGLIIMGTIAFCNVLQKAEKSKYIIYAFLLISFFMGVTSNIIFSINGISNEYQLFINGDLPVKSNIISGRYKNQSKFYSTVNRIVKPTDEIYFVNFEDEMAAYSNLKYHSLLNNTLLKRGDYLVVPAFYYLGAFNLLDNFQQRLQIVYELDNYKLFLVKN